MQIVEAIQDANVLDADGAPAYRLVRGKRYILYDGETARALRTGAVRLTGTLDRVLPPYRGERLEHHRLVLPFIGRLGDAIVTASCLGALCDLYPGITVDVACRPSESAVFELFGHHGALLGYPLAAGLLESYDFHLSFEDIETIRDGPRRSCADLFSACLRTPQPKRPPRVTIRPDVAKRWALPTTGMPRVGIHAGRARSPKSYPADLIDKVRSRLLADGFEVHLFGARTPNGSACRDSAVAVARSSSEADATQAEDHGPEAARRYAPSSGSSARVHDWRGRTPTPADLAALLRTLDAVVTGDSFPMHLAGALGVPTVALFTTTDAVIGSDYPSVTSLQSMATCSPCHVADGPCPLGHGECVAHRNESIDPARITDAVNAAVRVSPMAHSLSLH